MRVTRLLLVAGGLFLFSTTEVLATGFTFDIAGSRTFFTEETFRDATDAWLGSVAAGIHTDNGRVNVVVEASAYFDEDSAFTGYYELTGRYAFMDADESFRAYAGLGFSAYLYSYRTTLSIDPFNPIGIDIAEDGTLSGLKAVAGIEYGKGSHTIFVEAGYRWFFRDPFNSPRVSGADFNHVPLTIGYRFRDL